MFNPILSWTSCPVTKVPDRKKGRKKKKIYFNIYDTFYPFSVLLLCLSPCRYWTPHNHSLPPPWWDGGKNWEVKSRKSHGLRKVIFIGYAKAAPTGKADQGINSSLPMDEQVFNHPQKSMATWWVIIFWEEKCNLPHASASFLLPTAFIADHDITWSGLCPLKTFAPPASLLSLMLCDTVQQ